MAGCSKKQYAIMMNSGPEGQKLASEMGSMEQEEFNKAFADLIQSDAAADSSARAERDTWSEEEDEDYAPFDEEREDDYGFDEDEEEDVTNGSESEEGDDRHGHYIKSFNTDKEAKEYFNNNADSLPDGAVLYGNKIYYDGGEEDESTKGNPYDPEKLPDEGMSQEELDAMHGDVKNAPYVVDADGEKFAFDTEEEARSFMERNKHSYENLDFIDQTKEEGETSDAESRNYDVGTDEGWDNFKALVHDVAVDSGQNDIRKLSLDVIDKIIEKGNLPYTEEQVSDFIDEMIDEYQSRGADEESQPESNNSDNMNPNNPKYKGFSRSHITNAREVYDGGTVRDYDSGRDVRYSIIEYTPYGALQDGSNKKLYGIVTDYDGSDAPDIGAIVAVNLEDAKEQLQSQIQLAEEGSERYLHKGKWDEEWFRMLQDDSYGWDEDTKSHYSKKHGWDFTKPWEEQEHIKGTKK